MSDPLEADPLAVPEDNEEPEVANGVADTNGVSKSKIIKRKKKKKSVVLKIGKKKTKKVAAVEPVDNGGDDDGEYEVQEIVDHKKEKGKTLYRVRWKGYPPNSDSWLPAAELNCKGLLNKYKKHQEKANKDVYEVEKIVDHRSSKGKLWYRLRWVGYSARDDTWQEAKMLSCGDLIKAYNESRNEAILKKEQEKANARSKAEKQGGEYEVEQIVDKRVNKKTGATKFLIRWKGYDESSDTWENASDLNCPELIRKFNTQKKKPEKSRKRAHGSDEDSDDSDFAGGKRSKTEYEVSKILNARVNKQGNWDFYVMWKGYGPDECNWEPENNLSCQALIDAYFGKNKIPKAVRNKLEQSSASSDTKKTKQPRKPPAARKEYRGKTKAALKRKSKT